MTNPLKEMYEKFWVPVLGRGLMMFAGLIEGEEPQKSKVKIENNEPKT